MAGTIVRPLLVSRIFFVRLGARLDKPLQIWKKDVTQFLGIPASQS